MMRPWRTRQTDAWWFHLLIIAVFIVVAIAFFVLGIEFANWSH